MNYWIVTGSSSGLGKALCEEILEMENTEVLGISRTKEIVHERYRHLSLDLSEVEGLENALPAIPERAEKVYLINNAGTLGEVKPLAKTSALGWIKTLNLNVAACAILMKWALNSVADQRRLTIANISSGAGKYPVEGWAQYCASKAALDMLTRVAAEENPKATICAIAPGIVNTPMQAAIRESEKEDFPEVARFEDYHKNGDLVAPNVVADKILSLLHQPGKMPDVIFSVRDVLRH